MCFRIPLQLEFTLFSLFPFLTGFQSEQLTIESINIYNGSIDDENAEYQQRFVQHKNRECSHCFEWSLPSADCVAGATSQPLYPV